MKDSDANRSNRPWICCLFALLVVSQWALADEAHKPPVAAIASAYPLASEAGFEILAAGGNAFDAAVAVSAALEVSEPRGSGLGGGGFYLLHRASDGLDLLIDAREVAPAAATRDMFLDAEGKPVPGKSTDTALAAAIPGEVAAWAHIAEKFGRLPLRKSLQPAIRLARNGFPVYERLSEDIGRKRPAFDRRPQLGAYSSSPILPAHSPLWPRRAPMVSTRGRSPRSWWPECASSVASGRWRIWRTTA